MSVVVTLSSAASLAHGGDAAPPAKAAPRASASAAATAGPSADAVRVAAKAYFPDVELVDQFGRPHRFYSELVRGKIVVVNFGFTRCSGACSPIMASLSRVQKALGGRLGKDVVFLTVSVDPENDPPERLRAFGDKFGVGKGWYLLTGAGENVRAVLAKLGGSTPQPEAHSTVLLIGDERTGNWTKAQGGGDPAEIVHVIEHIND